MAKHKLKQKKRLAGKQWWADILIEGNDRENAWRKGMGRPLMPLPVSHHAPESCSACNAPPEATHWYPPVIVGLYGVWLCDSCGDPETVRERIGKEVEERRRVWRESHP